MLDGKVQNLSGEDAAHLMYRGQDPARSGQVSGRAEAEPHGGTPLERADVLSGSVMNMEPGGAGEETRNFLILLQQIIIKTKVQEQCQYELVSLAIILLTLLQTPYCPPDTRLLEEAIECCASSPWHKPLTAISVKNLPLHTYTWRSRPQDCAAH
ncbi:phosphoinositide 3-kinase regulatory subunit 5, partial [Lates japonicus]